MKLRLPVLLFSLLLLAVPSRVIAQEAGQAGLTMGYPASVGLLFHVSDRVAVRPELSVARNTGSSSGFVETESSGWGLGVGASALFYFASRDNVRPYFSPRFTYTRTSNSSSSDLLPAATSRSRTTGYGVAGSFGAQYTPNQRFAAFGEVGFGYTHGTSKSGTSTSAFRSNTLSTRTGAGVILYF